MITSSKCSADMVSYAGSKSLYNNLHKYLEHLVAAGYLEKGEWDVLELPTKGIDVGVFGVRSGGEDLFIEDDSENPVETIRIKRGTRSTTLGEHSSAKAAVDYILFYGQEVPNDGFK